MRNVASASTVAITLAGFAGAAGAEVYGDNARVLASTPVYERVSAPRRECRVEQVSAYEERRTVRTEPEYRPRNEGGIGAGTVLGAVIGGVVGHQFGNSTAGRDHGTAAGAVVGGLIGNQVDRDSGAGYRGASREVLVERVPVDREVERCDTIADVREQVVGYDVRYEYNGHEFTARLPYDPGSQLAVNVEVRLPDLRGPIPGPRAPNYQGIY